MKKSNDFDYIKAKFENENVNAPDSINEKAVDELIKRSAYKKPIKFSNKKRTLQALVSLAACFAIIIGTGVGVYRYNTTFTPKKSNVKDGIVYFNSYSEVERMMKSLDSDDGFPLFGPHITTMFSAKNMESAVDYEDSDGVVNEGFGKTNVQVEGIDEADIIKTDGRYIYYISASANDKVNIYSADKGKTELKSTIEISDGEEYFENIFVQDNKLFLLGTTSENKLTGYITKCFCKVFDLSDIKNPKEVHSYYQSGDYLSARLFNNTVYIVSSYYSYSYYRHDIIPYATNARGEFEKIPYNNYYAIKDSKSISYSVIGAIDISGEEYNADSRAVFGTSEDIYCSENNVYLFGSDWRDDYDKTKIIKFSLDKTDIKIKASTKVDGRLIGQYALDERYGNLRVATTSYNSKGDEVNNIYILNSKLKEIGSVEGFARNESIRAVKYIGDTAYVITFEQTDPLFVIDLKDSENPKILGEAKIDGFSTLLMPVDENTLLGIGYSTSTTEYDAVRTDGVKFTLFDVSDKLNPKVLDSKDYKNCLSTVQTDPKALVKNEDKGYFAIPVNGDKNGAFVIKTDNSKIQIKESATNISPERITYIGDYIYALTADGDEVEAVKE